MIMDDITVELLGYAIQITSDLKHGKIRMQDKIHKLTLSQ